MKQSMIATAVLCGFSLWTASMLAAEDRDTLVRADRDTVLSGGHWIYNDLEKGFSEASRTDKPLMVVLRCVP